MSFTVTEVILVGRDIFWPFGGLKGGGYSTAELDLGNHSPTKIIIKTPYTI